jgi:hypothetical protein
MVDLLFELADYEGLPARLSLLTRVRRRGQSIAACLPLQSF